MQLELRNSGLPEAAKKLFSNVLRLRSAKDAVAVMCEQGQRYAPQLPETEPARVTAEKTCATAECTIQPFAAFELGMITNVYRLRKQFRQKQDEIARVQE